MHASTDEVVVAKMPLDLALFVANVAKDVLAILGKPPAALAELVDDAEEEAEQENSHIPPVLVGLGLLKGIALGLQVPIEDVLTMAGVIPVHPTLAAMLGEWKESGWAKLMGHEPLPDDLLVPSQSKGMRCQPTTWEQLQKDLVGHGYRKRRFHDLRRTMISLTRADGARPDLLKMVTHGLSGNILDQYTEMPWEPLCEEVAKLKILRRTGPKIGPPNPPQGGEKTGPRTTGDTTVSSTTDNDYEKRVPRARLEGRFQAKSPSTTQSIAEEDGGESVGCPDGSPPFPKTAKRSPKRPSRTNCHTVTLVLEKAVSLLGGGDLEMARVTLERLVEQLKDGGTS